MMETSILLKNEQIKGLIITNKNKQKTRKTTILITKQRKQMKTLGLVWTAYIYIYIFKPPEY